MIKLLVSVLLLALAVSSFEVSEEVSESEWREYKAQFGKMYLRHNDDLHRKLYQFNLALIRKHNEEAANGLHSFTLGVNQYTDMDHDEIVKTRNGFKQDRVDNILQDAKRRRSMVEASPVPKELLSGDDLPESVDWRNQSLVTPVKDQGGCGSCWAFSAVASTEGQHKKATGELVSLSERQLVDCSLIIYGNLGCLGGTMEGAFKYMAHSGSDTEESYPYTDKLFQLCKSSKGHVGANVTGYVDLPVGDEKALQAAVAKIGPISVAIDASKPSFTAYKSGVYFEPTCSNSTLDHGVTVVGYGTQDGQDYWLVKNSWAAKWGEEGFIKMARNRDNNCGIATRPSYPLVN